MKMLSGLRGRPLFLACSGGVDSMVLLDLSLKVGLKPHVVHVNYGLRGEESDADALFVEHYCEKYNLPFTIRSLEIGDTDNIQLRARQLRYELLQELLKDKERALVLLAHHADDQVETFFMNVTRNSGVMGLSGMLEQHEQFVRPLLSFKKEEIISYAEENEIAWREDKSNEESKYVRNSWRNEYIPFIEKHIPEIKDEVLLLVSKFQELQMELESNTEAIFEKILRNNFINEHDLKALSELEQVELFRQLGQHPGMLEELKKLSQKGKKVKLKHSIYGYQYIIREENGYSLLRDELQPIPTIEIADVDTLPDSFDLDVIYLDRNKIKGELKLRYWREGDRISPVGLNGSKLVSDILTDRHVSNKDRSNQLVLCDDEHIHWVVGHKIGRKALATNQTSEKLKITIDRKSQ